MGDTEMNGINTRRESEGGSIGVLSAITGCNFTSKNQNDNGGSQSQHEPNQDREEIKVQNLIETMGQKYGMKKEEEVRKFYQDYNLYMDYNKVSNEIKEMPMC